VSGDVMVRATAVHKRFGLNEVLKGIDLEVQRGEVMCVIGPSGSGKSTLLRCINHLEQIHAGRLEVDGVLVGYEERNGKLYELREREVARRRAEIGMVFQHFNLFPHMTVLGNITEAPCKVKGLSRDQAVEKARQLLSQVGLAGREDAYPRQLSGGQQQRVAIARALVTRPEIVFADEPTAALDPRAAGHVLRLLRESADKTGQTVVLVTHDPDAAAWADSVVFLSQGKIIDEITGPTAAAVLSRWETL
jgi:polar amino acid transport system ATP-binding protein